MLLLVCNCRQFTFSCSFCPHLCIRTCFEKFELFELQMQWLLVLNRFGIANKGDEIFVLIYCTHIFMFRSPTGHISEFCTCRLTVGCVPHDRDSEMHSTAWYRPVLGAQNSWLVQNTRNHWNMLPWCIQKTCMKCWVQSSGRGSHLVHIHHFAYSRLKSCSTAFNNSYMHKWMHQDRFYRNS